MNCPMIYHSVRKKMNRFFIIIFAFISFQVYGQGIPEPMDPPRLVNDFAGLLNDRQEQMLERKLVAFSDTNSTQIAVVIVESLGGYDIVDFSQRLGEKWGVGRGEHDNGVVIVLKPKTPGEKGEVNIESGYGMEPIITDAVAKRIIEREMIPRFRQEDYIGGLDAATDVIISLASGQFSGDEYRQQTEGGSPYGLLVPIIVIVIILLMIRRSRSRYYHAGRGGMPFWASLWMLGSMSGGGRGSWNSFSSGSGSFRGGGSSFGGFGGGSFGGGGASGSW